MDYDKYPELVILVGKTSNFQNGFNVDTTKISGVIPVVHEKTFIRNTTINRHYRAFSNVTIYYLDILSMMVELNHEKAETVFELISNLIDEIKEINKNVDFHTINLDIEHESIIESHTIQRGKSSIKGIISDIIDSKIISFYEGGLCIKRVDFNLKEFSKEFGM